jgi:transposase
MDEHRLGLKPIRRRVWRLRGRRAILPVWPRYQWMYVFGFVHPRSGRTFFTLMPSVGLAEMETTLEAFAAYVGAGPQRRIALVLDGAGWHSPSLHVPEGVHLVRLPPYSPELQPSERLWPLLDEPLANRVVADMDELEEMVSERCRRVRDRPAEVRALTNFHWWRRVGA